MKNNTIFCSFCRGVTTQSFQWAITLMTPLANSHKIKSCANKIDLQYKHHNSLVLIE